MIVFSIMIQKYLSRLPQDFLEELTGCVRGAMKDAQEDMAQDPSFNCGPGINNRGRRLHQLVDYRLMCLFEGRGISRCFSRQHQSGEYILLTINEFEVSTLLVKDRMATPTLERQYQITRAANNPSGYYPLFDQTEGQNLFFVVLCYGHDLTGDFAFLYLPAGGNEDFSIERLELDIDVSDEPVRTENAVTENVIKKLLPLNKETVNS